VAQGSRLYIQGCTREPGKVQPLGLALAGAGLAERTSMVGLEGRELPYVDHLINLVVCAQWKEETVSLEEILRVLTPRGIAVLGTETAGLDEKLKKAGAVDIKALARKGWIRFSKPMPTGFDDWTHNLGGPDLSYVNEDGGAGPWEEIRWIGDPRWGALYSAYHGRVTAGGRLYYLENNAAPGGITQTWLVARDAWNGFDLWRQSIGSPPKYGTAGPTLTCDDTNVYSLEENKTVVARDGRNGKKLLEYTPGFVPKVTTSEGSALLVCDLGISPPVATKVAALDKNSGKILWQRPGIAHPPAEKTTSRSRSGTVGRGSSCGGRPERPPRIAAAIRNSSDDPWQYRWTRTSAGSESQPWRRRGWPSPHPCGGNGVAGRTARTGAGWANSSRGRASSPRPPTPRP